MDSVGVGHAPDADRFGDRGANTLGHIEEAVGPIVLPCDLWASKILQT